MLNTRLATPMASASLPHIQIAIPREKKKSKQPSSPSQLPSSPMKASKRELLGVAVGLASLAMVQSAQAEQQLKESSMKQPRELVTRYYSETEDVHRHLRAILDITAAEASPPPGKPEDSPAVVAAFKKDANDWTADYRRLISPSRKSFSETYGAISALSGQFTQSGFDRPLPRKLRDNVEKRLGVAEQALKREKSKLTQA